MVWPLPYHGRHPCRPGQVSRPPPFHPTAQACAAAPCRARARRPHQAVSFAPPAIGAEEIAEVVETLESGWLSTGPRVASFEQAFAEYTGAEHAIALNSCTAALHLSLLAAGVGEGDEVVTTPLTFCATANVVVHSGATPVFADIDPITFNLDPLAAHAAVTSRTRAILPVHFGGRPADMTALRGLAARKGLTPGRGCRALRRRHRPGPQGGVDRRLHLLQLLRDEEPDDRRGRDGDDLRRQSRGVHPDGVAARHEPQRVDALRARRLSPVRRADAGLQIQHDGPAGRARPAPARGASTPGWPVARPSGRSTTRRWPSCRCGVRRRCARATSTRVISTRSSSSRPPVFRVTRCRRRCASAASPPAFTFARSTFNPFTRSGLACGGECSRPRKPSPIPRCRSRSRPPWHLKRWTASSRHSMTSLAEVRVLFIATEGPRRGNGQFAQYISIARALGVRPLVAVPGPRHAAEIALALGADVIPEATPAVIRRPRYRRRGRGRPDCRAGQRLDHRGAARRRASW